MAVYSLNVESRSLKDPSPTQLRLKGEIPAVYYKKGIDSVPLKVQQATLDVMFNSHFSLIQLNAGRKKYLSVLKEVQLDPVTHKFIHLSFAGVTEGEAFTMSLPVKLIHDEDAKWQDEGGVSHLMMNHLEIEVMPKDLPENIEININDLEVGDAIHVKDLNISGVTFLDDPEATVVSISLPRAVEEPEAEEAAEGEGGAEVSPESAPSEEASEDKPEE